MYADVILTRPTHRRPPPGSDPVRDELSRLRSFTYRVPERLIGSVAVGQLVQAPLGSGSALGLIADLPDLPPPGLAPEAIRDLEAVLDPQPVVTPHQIELARWIAQQYLAPLSQAMRLVLPPGLAERTFVVIGRTAAASTAALSPDEEAALRLLEGQGGRMRLGAFLSHLKAENPEEVLGRLADQGLAETQYAFIPPKAAPPRVQFVSLLASEQALRAVLPRLGRPSVQADLLLALARRTDAPISLPELCTLAGCGPAPVQALERKGWVETSAGRTLLVALQPGPGQADPIPKGAHKQRAALAALRNQRVPAELQQFRAATGVSAGVLAQLEQSGLVRRVVEPPLVLLRLPLDKVLEAVIELRHAGPERAVLQALRGSTGRVWVGGLYAETGADLAVLQRLAEKGLIGLHAEETSPSRPVTTAPARRLTPEQEAVWRLLEGRLPAAEGAGEPAVILLHGVTGSGKTEIYLEALATVLDRGLRGIVLVPEISLTAQTVRRFEARFPGRVALLHSQLSLGQRYQAWDAVRRGQADILVGPRSALLAPVSRLGLIVVDEAHDPSFKQDDPIPLPPYDAREVAVALGRIAGAAVVLGSATPDLTHVHRAQSGEYTLLTLPHRVLPPPTGQGRPAVQPLPPVRIVDLRQELQAGNRSILSRPLQEALRQTLDAGDQAILYLNRRGAATFVLCRDCGYVARCPNCDVPLTYHQPLAQPGEEAGGTYGGVARPVKSVSTSARGERPPDRSADRPTVSHRLVCHHCSHRQPAPDRCPACGSGHIRFFGLGTERVEAAVRDLFPQACVLRWDRDTATGLDHERYLQAFLDHQADLLIGTQMIAKGLDLPLVTLVGVISADTAMNLPDFRAAERTFQLLTQVAGRAGRGRRRGLVIVQTYQPEHYAVQAAAGHDTARFFQQELALRRRLGYPPFSRLVALRLADEDPERCRSEAARLARWLQNEIRRLGLPDGLIGPAPCFFSRIRGRFRWQIVVRTPDPSRLLGDLVLPRGWRVDVDPVSLL